MLVHVCTPEQTRVCVQARKYEDKCQFETTSFSFAMVARMVVNLM